MTKLNITDRVQFLPPLPLAGGTGTIVNILRDCSGRLLYYVEIDGKPYRVGCRWLHVVDSYRAGLKKIAS
jgi:hypothetical protein